MNNGKHIVSIHQQLKIGDMSRKHAHETSTNLCCEDITFSKRASMSY
jgi:hypothetical protein